MSKSTKQVKEEEVASDKRTRPRNLGDINALTATIDNLESRIPDNLKSRPADSADEAVDAAHQKIKRRTGRSKLGRQRESPNLKPRSPRPNCCCNNQPSAPTRRFQGPNSEQTALSSDPWQQARSQSLRRFANRSTEDLLDAFRGQAAELEALREESDRYINELEELRNEAHLNGRTISTEPVARESATRSTTIEPTDRIDLITELESARESERRIGMHRITAEIRAGDQQLAAAIARAAALEGGLKTITVPRRTHRILS